MGEAEVIAELVPLICASALGAATAHGVTGLALLYAFTFVVSIASFIAGRRRRG